MKILPKRILPGHILGSFLGPIWGRTPAAVFFFGLLGFAYAFAGGHKRVDPNASPVASQSAAEKIQAAFDHASGVPAVSSRAKLLADFRRAQDQEIRALGRRQREETQAMRSAQRARLREWENHEKDERHKFFAENERGADRRAYLAKFIDRRSEILASQNEERVKRAGEQEEALRSTRARQAKDLQEFSERLGRGERPADHLWPTPLAK